MNKSAQTVLKLIDLYPDRISKPLMMSFKKNLYSSAKQVEVNRKQSRVTVTGYVEAKKVLKRVKSTGKRAEIWPYVPYNLVAYPYVAGAYDKKAPSGYVRNVPQAFALAPDDQYTSMFSDENPHACAIM
ncbi:PREDICTED: heavy metal-associated isoprenylated plant protein 26-like isoform 2 [Fragaria vesca subsp. vesca]